MKYHTLIIDQSIFYRKGFSSTLQTAESIEIIDDTSEISFALAKNYYSLDLIFLGVKNITENLHSFLRALLEKFPFAKIIAIADELRPFTVVKLLKTGIHGIIQRDSDVMEIKHAVNTVMSTGYYFNDRLYGTLINKYIVHKSSDNRNIVIDITDKEISVLELMADGYTTSEIADKMCLSKRTIEGIRLNLIDKTHCRNSIELIVYGIRNGIIAV